MSTAQLQSLRTTVSRANLAGETFLGRLARVPLRAIDTLLVWQQRSAERSQLASLSEHHLKDIGMTRADIYEEVAKPFWRV